MTHDRYMDRCLQLAEQGLGSVSPNPLVGCVIVHNDIVIGEGFHAVYGGPHAEVNAIDDVHDHNLLKESTLYVSLEPCSHHGKTPPCVDLIIRKGIPEVVIGNTDPNPMVRGNGIERLKQNGVQVTTGILEDKGKWVNRTFFKAFEQNIPYITLKWAQTADGFMGTAGDSSISSRISNTYSDKLVHKLRSENDAILIGSNTLKADNPLLTNRLWNGKSPVRVILGNSVNISDYRISEASGETVQFPTEENQDLTPVLNKLVERGIHSVLVEGGGKILNSFIKQGLWDEMITITGDKIWGKGLPAPIPEDRPYKVEQIGQDSWSYYKNKK